MIHNINLQLFADGDEIDEIDDTDLEDEVEEEAKTEEEAEGDVTEEETEAEAEEEPAKPKKDKVTAAIIREKQQNKALRDKLAALEREKADREKAERDRQLKQRLIDEGLTEQEAEDRIADRREREELKQRLRTIEYKSDADRLAKRYPDIYEHLDSFINIVESSKGAITLAELCKAKLDEANTREIRTKAEQEALITRQKAKEKQIKTGEDKTETTVKLSADDERILAGMNRKRQLTGKPPLTKKQFQEYMNG